MANSKTGKLFRDALAAIEISDLETDTKKIEHLLRYASLAPSTHNTQPWQIKIDQNTVTVSVDVSKKIPEADPTERGMYISLGAFVKGLELAASAYNVTYSIQYDQHSVRVTFKNFQSMQVSEPQILENIRKRQNFRGFFDGTIDSKEIGRCIAGLSSNYSNASLITDKKILKKLCILTVKGLRDAYARPQFRKEIGSLINHNLSSKKYGLHGYSLRMNTPLSFIIPKIMKKKDIGAKLAALNKKSFDSAPGCIVLTSRDTYREWIETGRLLQGIMVRLTGMNIYCSIYAAAIETDNLRPLVAELVPKNVGKPQLLFCIGPSEMPLPYSVRKDLSDFLV